MLVGSPVFGFFSDNNTSAGMDIPYGVATGTDTYVVASFFPILPVLADGVVIEVYFANANTGPSTLNGDAIINLSEQPLIENDILGNTNYFLSRLNGKWQLMGISDA